MGGQQFGEAAACVIFKLHIEHAAAIAAATETPYDPDERFQSSWYRHYRTMFAS